MFSSCTSSNTLEKSPLHVSSATSLPFNPMVWSIICFHTPARNLLPASNATTPAKCLIGWRNTWKNTVQNQKPRKLATLEITMFMMHYLFPLTVSSWPDEHLAAEYTTDPATTITPAKVWSVSVKTNPQRAKQIQIYYFLKGTYDEKLSTWWFFFYAIASPSTFPWHCC